MSLWRRLLSQEFLARSAAVLALVGLALVVWSVLDPRPVPVVLAMTVGQAVGTASLALLVVAILLDLRWIRPRGGP